MNRHREEYLNEQLDICIEIINGKLPVVSSKEDHYRQIEMAIQLLQVSMLADLDS